MCPKARIEVSHVDEAPGLQIQTEVYPRSEGFWDYAFTIWAGDQRVRTGKNRSGIWYSSAAAAQAEALAQARDWIDAMLDEKPLQAWLHPDNFRDRT